MTIAVSARVARLEAFARAFATQNHISYEELVGVSKRRRVFTLRMMFAWVASDHGYASTDIGRALRRDHTSILSMLQQRVGPDAAKAAAALGEEMLSKAAVKTLPHPLTTGGAIATIELDPHQVRCLRASAERMEMAYDEMLSEAVTLLIRDNLFPAVLDR